MTALPALRQAPLPIPLHCLIRPLLMLPLSASLRAPLCVLTLLATSIPMYAVVPHVCTELAPAHSDSLIRTVSPMSVTPNWPSGRPASSQAARRRLGGSVICRKGDQLGQRQGQRTWKGVPLPK